MCYTIKINHTREALENRFGAQFTEPDKYVPGTKTNAFSLPFLPVICANHPTEIRLYRWGLIPYWTKNLKTAEEIRLKTFNARSESIPDKPSFKHCLRSNRCLVPVNGFYEWQTKGKNKIPYFIGLENVPIFGLAGLYDQWVNPDTGECFNTFTVITTRANPMLEVIHNLKKRMPVILTVENMEKWLDTSMDPYVEKVFEPFPEEKMFFEKMDGSPTLSLF
jgi:putative SOS response-associated peptidase YedK